MSQYITSIGGSRNEAEEKELQAQGFCKIDLKQESFRNAVLLWSKKSKKQQGELPITRFQVSFNDEMSEGLIKAGYTKAVEFVTPEGAVVLWYFCGTTLHDIPIVEMDVSSTPDEEIVKIKEGWEKVGCNVSDVIGRSGYLWIKREKPTYICDVTATNSYDKDAELFQEGYIRIDETTNTIFSGFKSTNFLWYRLSTDAKSAILDLKISANTDEYQQYLQQGYTLTDVNLNNGTGGRTVFLWHKEEECEFPEKDQTHVTTMLLFHHKFVIHMLQNAKVNVNEKNINEGNCGAERFLCFLKEQ